MSTKTDGSKRSSPVPHSAAQYSSSRPTGQNTRSSSFFTFPVNYAVSGILRRFNTDSNSSSNTHSGSADNGHDGQLAASSSSSLAHSFASFVSAGSKPSAVDSAIIHSPYRSASPFQPPPLTPLVLSGYTDGMREQGKLLSTALAEEIRLLVPSRLQLVDEWRLAYSLEQNGVSLGTLYQTCEGYSGKRGGFILVVKDGEGGVFGAYLSDAPHPSPHFYGNGECFLWRAHLLSSLPDLSNLPPPPSADTTNAVRMTTIAPSQSKSDRLLPPSKGRGSRSGSSTPERIRFKAFPYSGVNEFMMFCEAGYLSVGGGDGHYGLWLDDSLENGISESCPTFGNEPLSDEGKKFDVMGVELWHIGS